MLQALTQVRPTRQTSLVRSAAVAFFAAATFAATSSSAFAGTAEYTALNTQLGGSKTVNAVATATSDALATAVAFFLNPVNNPKLNPAIVAGEALRYSQRPDAGTAIADKILAFGPVTYKGKILDAVTLAGTAIKTTATGKGLTVALVPQFAAEFVSTESDAVALASYVKASKIAAGAVFQGYAGELGSDAAKQALAHDVLVTNTKIFNAAVAEVTTGIASTVTNSVAFTASLVNDAGNAKNLLKIIPAIVAAKTTDAGAITAEALNNTTYSTLGAKSPIIKAAATLAKTIGAVADIEQIEKVGAAIAFQITQTTTDAKGKVTPNIKLASATSIVTTLAKAISAKPFAATGVNRIDNKADELGELAAYFISGLSTSAEFTATKVVKGATVAASADKIVVAILKAAVTGGKAVKTGTGALDKTALAGYVTELAEYVAGSVALTVRNLPDGPIKTSIIAALNAPTFAKSVAGTSNATAVANAITAGLNGTLTYENGFDAAAGSITDPETNTRSL